MRRAAPCVALGPAGITSIIDKVQSFLTYWEKKYRHVWEADRDAYIRRYEKAQKPLSSFEADIGRYLQVRTLHDPVQDRESCGFDSCRFLLNSR
jgi:hypothetical protein